MMKRKNRVVLLVTALIVTLGASSCVYAPYGHRGPRPPRPRHHHHDRPHYGPNYGPRR
ncbi:hypothetical protein [Taibaiella chishuiensis]|uniref:Lipoprotein n=1 Tax=Taibaiella chishuiensis TaxID=1434707 RepID=A0A2P8DD26_9BACT|nr:hypothetical protein [Taibaiella chishuiensis]PSK95095.1 hypothetical protein B0I18_1011259 [Taibaiella chishuiensis]